jgi:phosphoribosylformylglycinamidine synthase
MSPFGFVSFGIAMVWITNSPFGLFVICAHHITRWNALSCFIDARQAVRRCHTEKGRFELVRAFGPEYGQLMIAKVIVMPKAAVLDPQGNAVRDAMRHLGMPEVRSVRIGKYMEIEADAEDVDVEKRLHGLCRDLLSNPVIEDYRLIEP